MPAMTLDELIVKIGADVTDLKKGLLEGEKGVTGFGKAVKKGTSDANQDIQKMADQAVGNLKRQAAAFITVAGAIALFTRALADTSALGRLSQQTGIAVENLSALRTAAAQVGVEFQTVEAAIRGFTQRAAEGLGTALSPISVALNSLGVSARDAQGQVRNFFDILPDVADAFSQYQDGVTKAQVATALFGEEAGPKLITFLNRGRAGLAEFIAEAKRLGVVTEDQVRTADEYQQATSRMTSAISDLVKEFSIRLAPAVTLVANAITGLLRLLPQASSSTDFWGDAIKQLELQIAQANPQIASMERQLQTLSGAAKTAMEARLAHARASITAWQAEIESIRLGEEVLNQMRARGGPGGGQQLPDQAAARLAAAEAMKQAQFQLSELEARLQGQRLLLDDMNFAWQSHAEIIAQATEHINRAYESQGDRRRALAQLEKNLNLQNQQQMLDTASLAGQVITQLWPQQKGAAIAAAVINTAVGITRALSTLLPPWSWIQAGLIAASGAAQIATIKATNESGGPTPTTGGSGAGAAQAVTPPEGSGQGGRSLHITGIDPAAIFSGRVVEGLIEAINDEVQNGATLISTRNVPV